MRRGLVKAKPLHWDEVQANNALDEPDPSLPTLEGVPAEVVGPLDYVEVKSDLLPSLSYERLSINGIDVDPDTVEQVDE